jgi:hypothetical protein
VVKQNLLVSMSLILTDKVDFENLMKRQKVFVKEERLAFTNMNS